MNTYHDLERVEARLRRLETRLCKLMIHLGLDPQTNEPLGETPAEPPKDYPHDNKQTQWYSLFKRPN
jgi:hypothetical protein